MGKSSAPIMNHWAWLRRRSSSSLDLAPAPKQSPHISRTVHNSEDIDSSRERPVEDQHMFKPSDAKNPQRFQIILLQP
jgi:hypothetical protein